MNVPGRLSMALCGLAFMLVVGMWVGVHDGIRIPARYAIVGFVSFFVYFSSATTESRQPSFIGLLVMCLATIALTLVLPTLGI